jgi:hypothetical protein
MRIVACVGGADRHLMAAARKSGGERPDNPRNAAVGPGVSGIGSDMEDAHGPSPYLVPAEASDKTCQVSRPKQVTVNLAAADKSGDSWRKATDGKRNRGLV